MRRPGEKAIAAASASGRGRRRRSPLRRIQHRRAADGEQREVGQPHREGGRHPPLDGPGLAAREKHVVPDEDREREREPASAATSAQRPGERDADEREGETGERNRELLVELRQGEAPPRVGPRQGPGGSPELGKRSRPNAALRRDPGAGAVDALAGEQEPLRGVPAGPVPRGIVGIDLVDGRAEEVEPEPVVLERQHAPPGDDDPVGWLGLVAELQEHALERPVVGSEAIEEEQDPGPRLAKRPRGDDVDDRRRGHARHRPLELGVGRRQDQVVDREDDAPREPRPRPGPAEGAPLDRGRRPGGRRPRSRPRAGRPRSGRRGETPSGASGRRSTGATERRGARPRGRRRCGGRRSRRERGWFGSGGRTCRPRNREGTGARSRERRTATPGASRA